MWLLTCKQLLNRWRASLSVCLELLLVFCLTWFLLDYFFVECYNRSLPDGRSYRDVWLVEMGLLPENAREYVEEEADSVRLIQNYRRVQERLEAYPGVEAVGASWNCASIPYSLCLTAQFLENLEDTSRTETGLVYEFDPATDFPRVFAHRRTADGRLVSSADYDWGDPHAVLISAALARSLFGEEEAVGRRFRDERSEAEAEWYRVADVLRDIKRFDNDIPRPYLFRPVHPDYTRIADMNYFIRTDASQSDERFAEAFRERMSRELRVGNFYLKRLIPYDRYKADMEYATGTTYDYRVRVALLAFLGVNVFLCVVGTFWFRVRMRRGEIGLRMALGSSRRQVLGLMSREGIVLLACVTPVALFIEAQFVFAGMMDLPYAASVTLPERYWPAIMPLRFLVVNVVTWLKLAVAIVAAVWIPARQASRMEPAEALRYE